MPKVHVDTRKRCYNHPHRETSLVCGRCKTSFCEECLVDRSGSRLCPICAREIDDLEASKLTFQQRAIGWLRSLRNGLIVAAVLVVLLGGVFLLFRRYFDRPITPEELARFRYALAGTFETDEGICVSSTVFGGQVVSATSAADGYPAKQLINEYTGEGVSAWRSTDAALPQEIVVSFQDPAAVQKVVLNNGPAEPPESYVQDFEVLVSTDGPTTGFTSVGKFRMAQSAELQRFEFPPTLARWIKLRILTNYGSTEYTSLDEFDSYVVPANSLRAQRTPTAAPGR